MNKELRARLAVADPERDQAEARRVLDEHFPYVCCAICGLENPRLLMICHLNHKNWDNRPENLARLCRQHHWMHDGKLYPTWVVVEMQKHWQITNGVPDHRGWVGANKAHNTRKRNAHPSVAASIGRFRLRSGAHAEVTERDADPHPYPWMGQIPGADDDDGWDDTGRSWKSAELDLVERIGDLT